MFIHMNETYSNSKREQHFTSLLHIAAMLDGFRLLLLILQKGEILDFNLRVDILRNKHHMCILGS